MEYDRRDFYNVVHFELYGYPGRKKSTDATNAAFDDDEEARTEMTVNKFVNFGMKQLENFGSVAANATEAAMSRGKELSTKVIPGTAGTSGTSESMVAKSAPVNMGRIRPAKMEDTRKRYGLQIGLACVVSWCCNPPFGLTAFILAMLASKFSSDNKILARRLARVSLGVAVIGIVVSVVAVSLGIGIYYGYLNKQCWRIVNGDCYFRYSK